MLQLSLLGTPELRLNGTTVSLNTAKERALFFYLAVTGKTHSRETLVHLLWGEMDESRARRNLTATLSGLRKALAAYLIVDPDQVAFDSTAPHAIDVHNVRRLMESGCQEKDFATLRQAVVLYEGDFLAGFSVRNAFEFEEWVLGTRERLRERMLDAMQTLVDEAVTRADYANGIDLAMDLLAMDPWRESAHRQLMLLYAQSGRIDAAMSQYERCREVLDEELGVDPAEETTALYTRLQQGSSAPPHNLPPQPNTFIGRGQELSDIAAHIRQPDCRVLTIFGPGGIGKTRLAIEATRPFTEAGAALGLDADGFVDGIFFISLVSVDPDDDPVNGVLNTVANSIGYAFSGAAPIQRQLLNYLNNQRMLLICDNFEHLITNSHHEPVLDLLAGFLRQAQGVKLLVTSRQRLNLQEEWVYEIAGLAYPKERTGGGLDGCEDTKIDTEALENCSAIALFVQRAQQAQNGFTLRAEDAPHVIQLCQMLEGMPLGLELAASWVRDLSCAELVEEIAAGVDALSAPLRNVPSRHRSLHAVFDYSWQRLSTMEARVLSQLSIFRGGFDHRAATRITGAPRTMLVRLADQSLLRRATETGDNSRRPGRYEMHERLRQFAATRLVQYTADVDDLSRSYSEYFAEFAARCFARYEEGNFVEAAADMRLEMDNLRSAWNWLILAVGRPAETEFALEQIDLFLNALGWYFRERARFAEGEALMRSAIDALNAALASGQHPAHYSEQMDTVLARLRIRLADLIYYVGKYEQSEALIDAALPQVQRANLVGEEALALIVLTKSSRRRGDYARTKALARRSESLFQQVNDPWGVMMACNALATTAADEGEYAIAESLGQELVRFYRQWNDSPNHVMCQSNLGNTYIRQGKYAAALPLLQEAHDLAQQDNNRFALLATKTNLARAYRAQGDWDIADALNRASLDLAREIGSQRWTASNLNVLSCGAMQVGNWAAAEEYALEALTIHHAIHSETDALGDIAYLGRAWANSGRIEEAFRVLTYMDQHPAATIWDREQQAPLLHELRDELPAAFIQEAADWAAAQTMDQVVTWIHLRDGEPASHRNHALLNALPA